jgi:hypothetical protein
VEARDVIVAALEAIEVMEWEPVCTWEPCFGRLSLFELEPVLPRSVLIAVTCR